MIECGKGIVGGGGGGECVVRGGTVSSGGGGGVCGRQLLASAPFHFPGRTKPTQRRSQPTTNILILIANPPMHTSYKKTSQTFS